MRNRECKNYTTCLDIASKSHYKDFTCEGCDGTVLLGKEAPKTKWCKGIMCLQISPDGVEKSVGDFCKNSATKDKLQYYCRKCTAEMTRRSYQLSKKKAPKETAPEEVAVKDLLMEKMMERLRYHQEEVQRITDAFTLIKEITGESFLPDQDPTPE